MKKCCQIIKVSDKIYFKKKNWQKIYPTLSGMVEYGKYWVKTKEKPKYVKTEYSYCIGCRNKTTKNKNIKGMALENEIGQQKSTCVKCVSKKSVFVKKIQT